MRVLIPFIKIESEDKPKDAKPVAITLIEAKRANNCGTSFKFSFEEVLFI